ncbi:hypothetical protein SERLADRAFT_471200 [Serpula lacrymans var. lacrymans S7.9]|uniref:Uncharacterized protein n=1 Tax=Serpula lacrymans var. lacrymans (strain S7.9) TaxID=578457 RepID=F8P0V1_SERL9|nr:uncharacterized protein SERLADRAFT_471200 [Serpula lacrymans var. lacrymans S7.9]EGO22785.1 hypothetical protein SERLADRAFT_471200 [Serpula lacrymans var. lacrymans S7.9]
MGLGMVQAQHRRHVNIYSPVSQASHRANLRKSIAADYQQNPSAYYGPQSDTFSVSLRSKGYAFWLALVSQPSSRYV